MSKYTTEVRYICEMNSGFPVEEMDTHSPDEIITASLEKIFNFTFPIYEESHREELERKILKHYYTREIGAETVGLWKLWLNEKLNLIMPKYNKLYKLEHDYLNKDLYNIDVEKNILREDDFTKESDFLRTDNLATASTGTTIDKYSDTPQGTVSNVDNNTYLTDYRNIGETNSQTNTGTQRNNGTEDNTGTQEITETEKGYRGGKTYAEMLSEYSERVLNIDSMIIDDLRDLFILLW